MGHTQTLFKRKVGSTGALMLLGRESMRILGTGFQDGIFGERYETQQSAHGRRRDTVRSEAF
jgi:hypothetical protein